MYCQIGSWINMSQVIRNLASKTQAVLLPSRQSMLNQHPWHWIATGSMLSKCCVPLWHHGFKLGQQYVILYRPAWGHLLEWVGWCEGRICMWVCVCYVSWCIWYTAYIAYSMYQELPPPPLPHLHSWLRKPSLQPITNPSMTHDLVNKCLLSFGSE